MLAAITLACSLTSAPTPEQSLTSASASTPTLSATKTPTSTQTPMTSSPTAPPLSLTATLAEANSPDVVVLNGPHISWNGISFELNPVFGRQVYVFDEQIKSPEGLTAQYTRFALTEEEYCQNWCVQVYPVEQFQQAFGRFVFPPAGYGGGAAIILHAQDQPLNFQNGAGERALEMHGQMSFFVSNETLFYNFRGTTQDEKYAVYVKIPIAVSILASTGDPEQNTNLDAILIPTTPPDMAYPEEAILAYNQEAVQKLNQLAPQMFDPDLRTIDALVASLQVKDIP